MATSRDTLQRILVTRSSLVTQLAAAGIGEGTIVLAHVGLSRLGYVCGAAQAVIEALLDAVGPNGTLMMPSFSGELSDPATWRFPPVPDDWVEPMRREMPPFDPILTPTRQMGVVAELFRTWPGVRRSSHPHSSFCAFGPQAVTLVGQHPLEFRFGPRSPLGRLAALDGTIVLLGAGIDRASVVYLGQYLAGIGEFVLKSSPMLVDGERRWVEYEDFAASNPHVVAGMTRLLACGIARRHPVGDGEAIVFSARRAVTELANWAWRGSEVTSVAVRPVTTPPTDWTDWLH